MRMRPFVDRRFVLAAAIWREILAKECPECADRTAGNHLPVGQFFNSIWKRCGPGCKAMVNASRPGGVAVLVALIGGRIRPSLMRNWMAELGLEPHPEPFGTFDKLATGIIGIGHGLLDRRAHSTSDRGGTARNELLHLCASSALGRPADARGANLIRAPSAISGLLLLSRSSALQFLRPAFADRGSDGHHDLGHHDSSEPRSHWPRDQGKYSHACDPCLGQYGGYCPRHRSAPSRHLSQHLTLSGILWSAAFALFV